MYDSLQLFRLAEQMARHAGGRQAVVARNMANADTPGYRAESTVPFSEIYRAPGEAMRATRPDHLALEPGRGPGAAASTFAEPAPNGNSVSIEMEMIAAAGIEREHSRALSVYRHGLSVIRSVVTGR